MIQTPFNMCYLPFRQVQTAAFTHVVPHTFYKGVFPTARLVEHQHGGFDLKATCKPKPGWKHATRSRAVLQFTCGRPRRALEPSVSRPALPLPTLASNSQEEYVDRNPELFPCTLNAVLLLPPDLLAMYRAVPAEASPCPLLPRTLSFGGPLAPAARYRPPPAFPVHGRAIHPLLPPIPTPLALQAMYNVTFEFFPSAGSVVSTTRRIGFRCVLSITLCQALSSPCHHSSYFSCFVM